MLMMVGLDRFIICYMYYRRKQCVEYLNDSLRRLYGPISPVHVHVMPPLYRNIVVG